MNKMGIAVLSYEALRQIMQLPDSAEVIAVDVPWESQVIRVKFQGAGYVTPEGAAIYQFNGLAHRVEDVKIVLDWGIPE